MNAAGNVIYVRLMRRAMGRVMTRIIIIIICNVCVYAHILLYIYDTYITYTWTNAADARLVKSPATPPKRTIIIIFYDKYYICVCDIRARIIRYAYCLLTADPPFPTGVVRGEK